MVLLDEVRLKFSVLGVKLDDLLALEVEFFAHVFDPVLVLESYFHVDFAFGEGLLGLLEDGFSVGFQFVPLQVYLAHADAEDLVYLRAEFRISLFEVLDLSFIAGSLFLPSAPLRAVDFLQRGDFAEVDELETLQFCNLEFLIEEAAFLAKKLKFAQTSLEWL